MKNPQIVFLVIIIGLSLVFGGYLLAPSAPTTNGANQEQAPAQVNPELLNNVNSPMIGKKDARAKVVIFSDFLCPYCKTAHETLNSLLGKFPDDTSVTYRNFIVHPESEILARAAEAAALQGQFQKMNDVLFSKTVESTEEAVVALAKEIGLDSERFKNDLNSDQVKQRIEKDNSDAKEMNLGGTPTVFLNEASVDDFSNLEAAVTKMLGK